MTDEPQGIRCPHDGGSCHHNCAKVSEGEAARPCFRATGGGRLATPWPGFPIKDRLTPVFPGEVPSCAVQTDSSVPVGDLRSRALDCAGELAGILSRYAAKLEGELPQRGVTFTTSSPAALQAVQDKINRAKLAREMSAIYFRAIELEKS